MKEISSDNYTKLVLHAVKKETILIQTLHNS